MKLCFSDSDTWRDSRNHLFSIYLFGMLIARRLATRALSRVAANTTKKAFAELPAVLTLSDGSPAPPLPDWHACRRSWPENYDLSVDIA
jgi:hypothetical protein